MTHLRHPIVIASAVASILAVGAGYWFLIQPFALNNAAFVTVRAQPLAEKVSVSGPVTSATAVDLGFERSGKIARVNAQVGDTVSAGMIIVSLESADLAATLAGAEANLASQEAKLAELEKGARPEEITLAETQVSNAQAALDDATKSMQDKIEDAYTKSDQAIRNTADKFFTDPKASDPQITFLLPDRQLETELENLRVPMESILASWRTSIDAGGATPGEAKKDLDQLRSFLSLAASALTSAISTTQVPQSTLESWKVEVATARTNLNAAYAAITSGEDVIRNAQSALKVAQNQLVLKRAGAAPEQITAQRAAVASAQASVDGARAQLAKTVIRAPFTGVVTRQDAHAGAIASPNAPLVSMISNAAFQIEALVSEAEVAKIHPGDEVSVTLDAYGSGVIFPASVASVDPSATINQGVSSYRIVIQFKEKDERIKTGMTANAQVITTRKENVLAIPWNSIIQRGGGTFVTVKNSDGSTVERNIQIGVRGGDMVEVVSGLTDGELVASYGTN